MSKRRIASRFFVVGKPEPGNIQPRLARCSSSEIHFRPNRGSRFPAVLTINRLAKRCLCRLNSSRFLPSLSLLVFVLFESAAGHPPHSTPAWAARRKCRRMKSGICRKVLEQVARPLGLQDVLRGFPRPCRLQPHPARPIDATGRRGFRPPTQSKAMSSMRMVLAKRCTMRP